MATRRTSGWLAAALAAVALDSAAALWVFGRSPADLRGVVATIAVGALVSVVVGVIIGRPGGCALGAALLGAAFLISQLLRPVAAISAAVFGVVLFLALEMAMSAVLDETDAPFDGDARRHRYAALLMVGALGLMTTFVVAVAGDRNHGGGAWLYLITCTAAIGIASLIRSLAVRGMTDGRAVERADESGE